MSWNAILGMSYFAPVLHPLVLRTHVSHTHPNVTKKSVAHAFTQEAVPIDLAAQFSSELHVCADEFQIVRKAHVFTLKKTSRDPTIMVQLR